MKPERWIALSVIASSLFLVAALTVILGHFQFSPLRKKIVVYFPSCIGIEPNSQVCYAGAPVGRVAKIEVVPRAEQRQADQKLYCVKVSLAVTRSLEVDREAIFEIRQDGVLGAKFINITPGLGNAPLLADGDKVLGVPPVDLLDLAAPGKEMLAQLGPTLAHLNTMTEQLDRLLDNVGNEANRRHLTEILADMRVVSENLKVITTDGKAFSETVGQRPWRLFWSGQPNALPSEQQILNSPEPVPVPGAH